MIHFYLSFLLTMQNAYSFAYSVGSLFTSPFSSQCKIPTPLPILLDLHSAMQSATAEAYMCLHIIVGVSLKRVQKLAIS